MGNRWIAIKISAVIAIVGSASTLLFTALALFAAFFGPPPQGVQAFPIPVRSLMIAVSVVLALLTTWGFWTAIALFYRQAWARISMLVFALLLTLMCLVGMLAILLLQLPPPPGTSTAMMAYIRWVTAAFYAVPAVIGVWWLVLFNRPHSKEYFAAGEAGETAKPLSISIIAWLLLLSGALVAVFALFRLPAMLFGLLIVGWAAVPLYIALAAVQVYLGLGLLKLREFARIGTIAYFCLGPLSSIVSLLGPGYPKMMRQLQMDMPAFFLSGGQIPVTQTPWFSVVAAVIFAALAVFFLIRRRAAFH